MILDQPVDQQFRVDPDPTDRVPELLGHDTDRWGHPFSLFHFKMIFSCQGSKDELGAGQISHPHPNIPL